MKTRLDELLEQARKDMKMDEMLESMTGIAAPDAARPTGDEDPTTPENNYSEEISTKAGTHVSIDPDGHVDIDISGVNGDEMHCESYDYSDRDIAEILFENGYDVTPENVAIIREGLENGSIVIGEDNLDLSPDEMDDSVKNAAAGVLNSDDELPRDTDDEIKTRDGVVPPVDDDKSFEDNHQPGVLAGEPKDKDEKEGDLEVDVNKSIEESFQDIFSVFSSHKLSEECCKTTEFDIDKMIAPGGELVVGSENVECDDSCKKTYVSPRSKKDEKPKTIKEAVMLTPQYFNEESVEIITPEKKQERLTKQLAIRIAKEKMDPLFDELLKAAREAKKLQDAIIEKYKDDAKEKSDKLTKVEDTPKADEKAEGAE